MIGKPPRARGVGHRKWRSPAARKHSGRAREEAPLQIEADHRIANHLALLASYVRLQAADMAKQSAPPSHESVRLFTAAIEARIAAVARLYRSLAGQDRPASIDLGLHLHEVCTPLVGGLSGGTRLVERFEGGCGVRPDLVLPLTQMVAEVVTNALKHARSAGGPGVITVSCARDAAGDLLVEVDDDGPGLSDAFDPMTDGGLGFRLLRSLGKQVGGAIAFDSSRWGTHFRLRLPPARPTP